MARRITVLNEKGGVGKTTTAVNLAVALAQREKRVLLLDLDAQRNASQFVGLVDPMLENGTDAFILNGTFAPQRSVLLPTLDVIPASVNHALVERQLFGDAIAGPKKLKRALDRVADQYDFIVADCGPTLGMLALNAVLACPEVLVPIELAHAAAMGAVTLRKWLAGVQLDLDANVHIMGILPTFADEREKTPKEVLDLLREVFGGMLFNTVIHTSTAIRDAVKKGVPVVLGEPRTRGAEEYQSLTQEVVDRGNQH